MALYDRDKTLLHSAIPLRRQPRNRLTEAVDCETSQSMRGYDHASKRQISVRCDEKLNKTPCEVLCNLLGLSRGRLACADLSDLASHCQFADTNTKSDVSTSAALYRPARRKLQVLVTGRSYEHGERSQEVTRIQGVSPRSQRRAVN